MIAQKQKTFVGMLLLAGAFLLPPSSVTLGKEAPKRNEKAISRILTQERLSKLGAACPAWEIRTMVWPPLEEIRLNSVKVDAETKADCLQWLKKFMRSGAIPRDLDRHLVAMANWGLFREEAEQKALLDVFLCRFTQGPYVVHIQESPFNVVISVADERRADQPEEQAAHGRFIIQVASAWLHKDILPDPAISWGELPPKQTADGRTVTRAQWTPPSIAITDEAGVVRSVDEEGEARIGTHLIGAETDGAFVGFSILKSPGRGPRATLDPHVRRFGVSK